MQVVEWQSLSTETLIPSEWGWQLQNKKFVPTTSLLISNLLLIIFFKSLDADTKQLLPTILVGPTCAPVDVMDFRVYLSVTTVKRLLKKMTVVQMRNLVIQFTWKKRTCYLAQQRLFGN